MKRKYSLLSCTVCLYSIVSTMFTANLLYADWTLNGSTISDGDWTLNVTANGDRLTVTGVSVAGVNKDLDISTPVDGGGKIITGIQGFNNSNGRTITSLALPETLEAIGASAFDSCSSLTNIVPFLPGSVTSIGASAFLSCTKLEGNLVLTSSSLKTIPDRAFSKCRALCSVNMSGSGVTSIGNVGFGDDATPNTSITEIILPESLTTIGERAFMNLNALTEIVLPESLEIIRHYAFISCTYLTNVIPFLPGSVTNIGNSVFESCTRLSGKLVLSNPDLKSVGSKMCFKALAIQSVDMSSSGITSIGDGAFWDDYGNRMTIAEFFLPATLATVGANAFAGNKALRQMWFAGDVPSFGATVFNGINNRQTIVYVPKDNPDWDPVINPNITVDPVDQTVLDAFAIAFPDAPRLPIGLYYAPGSTSTYRQYLCSWNSESLIRSTKLIIR